jgi:hypothetical protein
MTCSEVTASQYSRYRVSTMGRIVMMPVMRVVPIDLNMGLPLNAKACILPVFQRVPAARISARPLPAIFLRAPRRDEIRLVEQYVAYLLIFLLRTGDDVGR